MTDFAQERGKGPAAEAGTGKKPYVPPRLAKISLRPEEAVLGNCKTASVAGPVSFSCTSTGACRTIGS